MGISEFRLLPLLGVIDIPAQATAWIALISVSLSLFLFLASTFFLSKSRKQLKTFAASERELQAVFDHTIELICMLSVTGDMLRINRSALNFAGTTEEEVIGKPLWETPVWERYPSHHDELRKGIRDAASGAMVRFHASFYHTNGQISHIDISIKPVRNGKGQITMLICEARDITSQKETEEKLLAANRSNEENLALLATLQKAAPIGLGFVDRELRYVRCNDALAEINGLFPADHIGKRVWEVVPHLWPQLQPHYERVRSGQGPVVNCEIIGETAARPGVLRIWHVSYFPVMIREETIGTGIIVSEITEQKRFEQALRSSEARSRAILQALPDLMLCMIAEGVIVNSSPTRFGDFGLPTISVQGKRLEEVLPPAACGLFRENLARTLEARQSRLFEYHLDISGEKMWFEARMVLSGDREAITIVRNITERKRSEAAIEQERSQLTGIINSAMDGIITIDESQRIVLFNAAAEKIFQHRAKGMIGQSIDSLIPERFRFVHASHIRDFSNTNVSHYEMAKGRLIAGLRASGEEFPIEASISQITLNGKRLFTLTCRDVTERVRAEEIRQKLEAQLRQSQKMEAIGLLAGGVAHDFNNLLTVISSYTEVLLESLIADEKLHESAWAIKEASNRAAALTRQLLLFSRQHVPEAVLLNLNTLVREAEKMLRRMIGEDIHFRVSLATASLYVKADSNQLNQVLMNLAVNARDAMPKGGSLAVETRIVNAVINPDAENEFSRQFARLTVADTGIGMTAEVSARIFEPFFTTKGVGKGTGLGLAVVHGIIEQCGGRIQVESEFGVGTTFHIDLPIVSDLPDSIEEKEPSLPPRGSETILLVEDDEAVRKLARLCLLSHGYRVIAAEDGKDALRVVDEYPHPIDMLLTDVVMPNMDGLDLAEALHARLPGLKILLMSGYSGDAVRQRNMTQEDISLLQKPYTPLALLQKVREVLDHAST